MEINLDDYGKVLFKLKSEITSADLFNKRKVEEVGSTPIKSEWKTIFNSDKAALR